MKQGRIAHPPINTGKVLIGQCYVPPPQRLDADACRVQSALIKRPARDRSALWAAVVSVAFLIAVFAATN